MECVQFVINTSNINTFVYVFCSLKVLDLYTRIRQKKNKTKKKTRWMKSKGGRKNMLNYTRNWKNKIKTDTIDTQSILLWAPISLKAFSLVTALFWCSNGVDRQATRDWKPEVSWQMEEFLMQLPALKSEDVIRQKKKRERLISPAIFILFICILSCVMCSH